MSFPLRRRLGRTGLEVSPIGLGSSFGLSGEDVERAFERGVNYFYWGSWRRSGFGRGIRQLARTHRDDMVVVLQSYSRSKIALRASIHTGLRRLQLDRADILLLGWWNKPPPERILDAALAMREAGLVGHIMVSCHDRLTFARYISDPCYDAIMVRYNAAHPGAEREVFPHLDGHPRPPGVVAYTATRWGSLLDRAMLPDDEPAPRASDCYRFALSNPHVDLCLSGPKDGAQLDEALAALDRGPMTDDELAWMRRVGAVVHQRAGRPTGRARGAINQAMSAMTGRR